MSGWLVWLLCILVSMLAYGLRCPKFALLFVLIGSVGFFSSLMGWW